jgi:hypothetical protein
MAVRSVHFSARSAIWQFAPWVTGAALCLATLLAASPARALTQPGSTTLIPTDDEVKAALLSQSEPQTIEPRNVAAITPETFRPECSLTFTVLLRMSDYRNSFGWYNVTGTPPTMAELHEFMHCNDPPVNWDQSYTNLTSRTLDVRADSRYLGGEIGFFQAVSAGGGCADVTQPSTVNVVFYSQRALNPDSTQQNPFIHLLIMNSEVADNVFYFAWEDQLRGDDDFSDLVLRVEGIACSGGGEDCETNLPGVCGKGATRCSNGEIICAPRQPPSDEACNGLDDDCNGVIDDGDLCGDFEICDRGRCIHACGGSEFPCGDGEVCRSDGYCADAACADKACDPGQICVGGSCVDPCKEVKCPFGQECRAGPCVDSCAGVSCGDGQVCVDGACITDCNCSGCATPLDCDEAQGRCVVSACLTASCGPGAHCEGGACVDNCLGAVCPRGQTCNVGNCEGEILGPVAGSDAGADSGIFFRPDAGVGAGGTGASSSGGSRAKPGSASPGCACHTTGSGLPGVFGWIIACAVAASLSRRRRQMRR